MRRQLRLVTLEIEMRINDRGAVLLGQDEDDIELLKFPITNLPFKEVYWNVPVFMEDIGIGKSWPNDRIKERYDRANVLNAVSKGNISNFVDTPFYVDRYDSLRTITSALLCGDHPEAEGYTDLEYSVSRSDWDGATYGKSLFVGTNDGMVNVPDIRNCWPIGGTKDDWIILYPRIGPTSKNGEFTSCDVWILNEGNIVFNTYEVRQQRKEDPFEFISLVNEDPILVPARWKSINDGIVQDGWGTSQLEKLIPALCEFTVIENLIMYLENELPILTLDQTKINVSDLLDKNGSRLVHGAAENITKAAVREIGRIMRTSPVFFGGEGTSNARWIEKAKGSESAQSYLSNVLNNVWTQLTGQVAYESGDLSEASSGESLARRQANLVVRCVSRFNERKKALDFVTGQDVDWDFDESALLRDNQSQTNTEVPSGD